MTKEEIFREFMSDNFFVENDILSQQKAATMKFSEQSGNKLIEVIKIAIDSMKNAEGDTITARKLNQYLNK